MRSRLAARLPSKVLAQAIGFAGSNVLMKGMTAVATVILARTLSIRGFGTYSFAVAFLLFVAMFFEFGVFVVSSRQIALARDEPARHELFGAALIAYAPIGFACSAVVFGLSFVVDGLFHANAGEALRVCALAASVFPFEFLAVQVAQGMRRVHTFSAAAALTRAGFVAGLTLFAVMDWRTTPAVALLLQAAALLLGWLGFTARLRPSIRHLRTRLRGVLSDIRAYGLAMYGGRVLSIGTYNMDVLMVARYAGAGPVALYALAGGVASVVSLPALGLGTSLFATMAAEREIRRGVLPLAFFAMVAGVAILTALASPIIEIAFSTRYEQAAGLIFPLALAEGIRGVTAIYNSFLAAHGRGRELSAAAGILTASNLGLNFVLIPRYGARGAAWASVLALVLNLGAHIYAYATRTRRADAQRPRRGTDNHNDDIPAVRLDS